MLDKYGRTWHFTPDHDVEQMLQLPPALAAMGYDMNRALRGAPPLYAQFVGEGRLEPYLLKMHSGWVMGMRYGDDGCEYYSPDIDDRVIALMIEAMKNNPKSLGEYKAIWDLVGAMDIDTVLAAAAAAADVLAKEAAETNSGESK